MGENVPSMCELLDSNFTTAIKEKKKLQSFSVATRSISVYVQLVLFLGTAPLSFSVSLGP